MACDIKILTGLIESHLAEHCGGERGIMPEMAGHTTMLSNQGTTNVNNPKSTWGFAWGNPTSRRFVRSPIWLMEYF
jgi:hypothetical protein